MRMVRRRKAMTMLEEMKGLKMTSTGPRILCRGSRRPQLSFWAFVRLAAVSSAAVVFAALEVPLGRLPLVLVLEPTVAARGRDVRPARRALTRSFA